MTTVQGGPAQPVYVIDDTDLVENGGYYVVAGRSATAININATGITPASIGALAIANNLSDVANATTSRIAIGAASTTDLTNHTTASGIGVHGAGSTGADLLGSTTPYAALNILQPRVTTTAGASYQINGLNGSAFIITSNGDTVFTFTNIGSNTVTLFAIQDAVGSRNRTFTGVMWMGGIAPTLSATANSIDVLSFFGDGTNVYGSLVGKNFS